MRLEYGPQSGEILGILKQLHDEMMNDLAEVIAAVEAAFDAYKELLAAKEKEIASLTKTIEERLTRVAELGVGRCGSQAAALSGTAAAPTCGNEYWPQSGEILGILKQPRDEMVMA